MIEVWQALQNADLTEGRGPMVPKASFLKREDAVEAARRLDGVGGYGCGEVADKPLVVYETFGEWPLSSKTPKLFPDEQIRANARSEGWPRSTVRRFAPRSRMRRR